MKVLFLDIDGVLNKDGTKEKCEGFTGVDRRLLQKLTSWLETHPEVNLVLSSTWRTDPKFIAHLLELGLNFYGYTPQLHVDRGLEILSWLTEHPEVKHWAVLDDCQMKKVGSRLVLTSPKEGLQIKHLAKIEHILLQ